MIWDGRNSFFLHLKIKQKKYVHKGLKFNSNYPFNISKIVQTIYKVQFNKLRSLLKKTVNNNIQN